MAVVAVNLALPTVYKRYSRDYRLTSPIPRYNASNSNNNNINPPYNELSPNDVIATRLSHKREKFPF